MQPGNGETVVRLNGRRGRVRCYMYVVSVRFGDRDQVKSIQFTDDRSKAHAFRSANVAQQVANAYAHAGATVEAK